MPTTSSAPADHGRPSGAPKVIGEYRIDGDLVDARQGPRRSASLSAPRPG
jgi:hypothetical protein